MTIVRVFMRTTGGLHGWRLLVALIALGCVTPGCSGNSNSGPATERTEVGRGTLTVTVTDAEGNSLANAEVRVYNKPQFDFLGSALTNTLGVATIRSLPKNVHVDIRHERTEKYVNASVSVTQDANTWLSVSLLPARPQPTVALLPVSIPAASVTADRSELTLQVTVVASAAARFVPAGYGDYSLSTRPSPSLALELGSLDEPYTQRQCSVWLDRTRTTPSCGDTWGESAYTVNVLQYAYDPVGTPPVLAVPTPANSAMLILDQSARVAELDPGAARSFAARAFINRAIAASQPESLAIAGFAGDGGTASAPATLPERPLWLPLGSGLEFSSDAAFLRATVGFLEPYIGGSAPVFDALETAFVVTTAYAPPGNRAIVAMLGGGDDGDLSESSRQAAIASLRTQRNDAGIQVVLIAAAPAESAATTGERKALADLSAALSAPAVSLGVNQTWESGSFAALDLAADLINGARLPSLSAEFRISTGQPDFFPAGTTLDGVIYVESLDCPFGCLEIPLQFAVEIP